MSHISLVKEGWESETSNKPKQSRQFFEDRALKDGRSSPTPRPLAATELDGKDGSEECLSSYPYLSQIIITFSPSNRNMFQYLPFGLSTAPIVFIKLLKPGVVFLRQ